MTSKLIERILAKQMQTFLDSSSLLSDHQFGFRKNCNTTGAINYIIEKLYSNLDESLITHRIFLDYSKAFDTVDHSILLSKIQYYNFSSQACLLIQSYLTDRQQFVQIDKTYRSSMRKVQIGVPQGSISLVI